MDTIHTMGVRSLHYFVDLLNLYVPKSVESKSLTDITTVWHNAVTGEDERVTSEMLKSEPHVQEKPDA